MMQRFVSMQTRRMDFKQLAKTDEQEEDDYLNSQMTSYH